MDNAFLEVRGELNGLANNTPYTLQIFGNVAADPTLHGEGQVVIGTAQIVTGEFRKTTVVAGNPDPAPDHINLTPDEPNRAKFHVKVPAGMIPAGLNDISTTATDSDGNTSEFSQNVPIMPMGTAALEGTATELRIAALED